MSSPAPAASVVIATRNRRAELRSTLEGIYEQTVPVELLVLDDASTDGTGTMVQKAFRQAVYRRFEPACGYIALRNLGNSMATTPVVFSLDDDAVLTSKFTIEQTLEDFGHERVGAVAIPFLDGDGRVPMQHPPDRRRTWITSMFIGAAHALRREVFLGLGGYYADWFRQAEELDLCMRMLDSGYVVRLGTADPLEHRPSPVRSFAHMDHYGRRNLILFTWYNVPTRYLPLHFARVTAKGSLLAVSSGRPLNHIRGFLDGWRTILKQRDRRRPVTPSVYRLHRLLRRRRAVPFDEIEPRLPRISRLPALANHLELAGRSRQS